MAAVNAGRVGRGADWWVGAAAAVVSIPLGFVPDLVWDYPSYWLYAAVDLTLVGLLWAVALRPQASAYDAWAEARPTGPQAGWAVPLVAGSPLALLTVFAYGVAAFIPAEPREVCDRFGHARTAAEAKAYATANFGPAIDALFLADDEGSEVTFELTDEAPAPPDIGGYLVAYRSIVPSDVPGGPAVHLDGVFHLVDFGGEWKIEDVYVTAIDGRELDRWISFARDYRQFLPAPAAAANPGGGGVLALFAKFQEHPKLVFGLLMLIGVIFGWIERLFGGESPADPPPGSADDPSGGNAPTA